MQEVGIDLSSARPRHLTYDLARSVTMNDEDCYRNPAPVCGECLWAQGIVLCP